MTQLPLALEPGTLDPDAGCQTIIGEPKRHGTRYCGAPKLPGQPWCACCRAKFYRPATRPLAAPHEPNVINKKPRDLADRPGVMPVDVAIKRLELR
jgi:hypothetical protein